MYQSRRDRYLKTTDNELPQPQLNFLSLPYELRTYIYRLAGLSSVRDSPRVDVVHSCPCEGFVSLYRNGHQKTQKDGTDILYDNHGVMYDLSDDGFDCAQNIRLPFERCVCEVIPSQLLLVSRQIHDESLPILYSENKFYVSLHRTKGLGPLMRLRSDALRCLRTLQIRVFECMCYFEICKGFPQERILTHNSYNIKADESRFESFLVQISHTFSQLNSLVNPSLLNLVLTAKTRRLDLLQLVLNRTHSSGNGFRFCAVQVSPTANPPEHQRYVAYAKATVSKLTRQEVLDDHFARFAQLPQDVQKRVLYHSDLVSPSGITWTPVRDEQQCCGTCNSFSQGCCCGVRSPSFSSSCSCGSWSNPLFWVSRYVRQLSLEVFYTANRFIVYAKQFEKYYDSTAGGSLHKMFPRFLRMIPHQYKKLIRHLQFRLRPTYHQEDREILDHHKLSIMETLRLTMALVDNHLDMTKLTLTLDMASPIRLHHTLQRIRIQDSTLDIPVEHRMLFYWHQEIVVQGIGLHFTDPGVASSRTSKCNWSTNGSIQSRSLRNFFIHLKWPLREATRRHVYEKWLEQSVMGPHYNSSKRGKGLYTLCEDDVEDFPGIHPLGMTPCHDAVSDK